MSENKSPRHSQSKSGSRVTMPGRRVVRIVLTGGVAAGKSSMLDRFQEMLADSPIPAVCIRESATTLLAEGYTPDRFGNTAFQHAVFRRQLKSENRAFRRMLPEADKRGLPVLLLCDRGLCDGGAYLPPDTFGTICRSMEYSRKRLLGRYQGVLFLDSLTTRAELTYNSQEGNSVRLEENRERALLSNERTFAAWGDHPNLVRIPAAVRFSEKAEQTYYALQEMLRPWYGALVESLPERVR